MKQESKVFDKKSTGYWWAIMEGRKSVRAIYPHEWMIKDTVKLWNQRQDGKNFLLPIKKNDTGLKDSNFLSKANT